jgi:hypothetical protein
MPLSNITSINLSLQTQGAAFVARALSQIQQIEIDLQEAVSDAEQALVEAGEAIATANEVSAGQRYKPTVPAEFATALPFNVFKNTYGGFSTDLNPLSYKVTTTETYYIATDGSDSNNGLTPLTPKKSLGLLIDTLNLTPSIKRTIYMYAGTYAYADGIGDRNILFDFNLICPDGEVLFCDFGTPTWTLVDGQTNQYSWVGAGTGAKYAVYDDRYVGRNGMGLPFKQFASNNSASVEATPGSYRQGASGILIVHAPNSLAPTSDVKVIVSGGTFWNQTTAIFCYMEGIIFQGGDPSSIESQVIITNTTGTGRYFFNRCEFNYSTRENGIKTSLNANVPLFMYRCLAFGNCLDGFNYNSSGGGTQNNLVFEIDCQALSNGFDTASTTDNGSTSHNTCRTVRINTVAMDNKDRNIHDINTCISWLMGCVAGNATNSDADPYDNINFAFGRNGNTDVVTAYLDTCVSEGQSVADFGVFANSVLNHKNLVGAVEVEIADAGVYQRY